MDFVKIHKLTHAHTQTDSHKTHEKLYLEEKNEMSDADFAINVVFNLSWRKYREKKVKVFCAF